jgi:hypothetical protein
METILFNLQEEESEKPSLSKLVDLLFHSRDLKQLDVTPI